MILDKKTVQFFSKHLPISASKLIQKRLMTKGVNISQQLVYKILRGQRSDLNGVVNEAWEMLYEASTGNTKKLQRIVNELEKQAELIEKANTIKNKLKLK